MQNRDTLEALCRGLFAQILAVVEVIFFHNSGGVEGVEACYKLFIYFIFSIQKVYITFHTSIVIFKRLQAK